MTGRRARLVLVTSDGALVGSLAPIDVETPWWPDVEPVVQAVRVRYGIDVTVLRLLDAESAEARVGTVTYLAEVGQPVAAEAWCGTLGEHPLRQPYARPGGPAADLAWAARTLRERGLQPAGRPVQVKTWNLSSLWRLPLEEETAWLKVVPPFFAHEGPLLEFLAGEHVPKVIAQDNSRMLLAHIPGRDLFDADLPMQRDMVSLLVDLQHRWSDRIGDLLALGLPDWRATPLTLAIGDVVARTAAELSLDVRGILNVFVRSLPKRFAQLAECGLEDTLVHGDFHPLNVRGDRQRLTVLDWGDSGVGHPLLDQPAFLERAEGPTAHAIRQHWIQQWLVAAPETDPGRAAALLAPVAAARQAVVYRRFLDAIEPSEYPYHRADPAVWLARTAHLLRDTGST